MPAQAAGARQSGIDHHLAIACNRKRTGKRASDSENMNDQTNPGYWPSQEIAAMAAQIAASEHDDHHRRWATMILEAVLTMLELDSVEATPATIVSQLLDPLAMKMTWDSVRAKDKLTPQSAPVPMLDALTTLLTTPREVREMQFARVVSRLKSHA